MRNIHLQKILLFIKVRRKKLFIAVVVTSVLIFISIFYLAKKYPTTSPLASAEYLTSDLTHQHRQLSKEVIGFLPYWRLDDTKYLHFDLISEIFFFSLSADGTGNIIKVANGQIDPGWKWWQDSSIQNLIAKAQVNGDKFGLTISMQKNSTLESFLDNQAAQQILINNLIGEIRDKNLDAINLDFEYDGTPPDGYQGKFTDFATKFAHQFRAQSPGTELSIDFFPLSIRSPRLYDIPKLAPLFDKIIVMSYDYYSANSDLAGPAAPISGFAQGKYFFDVTTTYQDYLKVVPAAKIIMGVPYYGWDWPVRDGNTPLSRVLPQNDRDGYPAVLSYGRMRQDTDLIPQNCSWDDLAKEEWCYYTDKTTNQDHQAWFENDKSIDIKYDFANSHNLSGVAIWTLGYDSSYPDLWNLLQSKFAKLGN